MTMDADAIFIDTNILIYATDDESPLQAKSLGMLNQLLSDGVECAICPQIVREYLVVLTRGLSPNDSAHTTALNNIGKFIEAFTLLDENHETVVRLKTIADRSRVIGKLIHDANIVAVMQVHGVRRLLTHNLDDFKRFTQWIEIITLEEPPSHP